MLPANTSPPRPGLLASFGETCGSCDHVASGRIAASDREPDGLSADEARRVAFALQVHAALEREYALLAA